MEEKKKKNLFVGTCRERLILYVFVKNDTIKLLKSAKLKLDQLYTSDSNYL